MNYIVFDPNDGRIIRFISCPESIIFAQTKHGEAVISGFARDDIEKVDISTVEVIPKTPEEIALNHPMPEESSNENERLIEKKQNEILRRMAIDELTKEGKDVNK